MFLDCEDFLASRSGGQSSSFVFVLFCFVRANYICHMLKILIYDDLECIVCGVFMFVAVDVKDVFFCLNFIDLMPNCAEILVNFVVG